MLSPRLIYTSVSREKGGGAKEFLFRDLQNFLVRRSIRDIGALRTCGTRGQIQGRTLGVSGNVCTCGLCFVRSTYSFSCLSTKSCSTCRLSLVWMVQFGQGYLIGFRKVVPRVSRARVPAVVPVNGRVLCGRGVRTLLGCGSLIVLYTPLVIISSRRHRDLAMVGAVSGWDRPSPG